MGASDGFNVWVSTFGLYNAGNLAGYWTPADEAPESIEEFMAGLEARGIAYDPRDVGEEIHCFDVENSPVDHEMSPSEARRIAALLAEIDVPADVLAAWLANGFDLDDSTATDLGDAYAGIFESLEDFAGDYLGESGMLAELPAWAQPYSGCLIESFAHDLELSGDVWTASVAGGVAVFHS